MLIPEFVCAVLELHPAIPLLQMHLEFLVNTFERYYGPEATGTPPDQLGDMFTPGWMRTTMSEVVERGMGHLTKVSLLFVQKIVKFKSNIMEPESFVVGYLARLGIGTAGKGHRRQVSSCVE